MKKKSSNLYQGTLPLKFQSLDKWPKGYRKGLDFSTLKGNRIFGMDVETIGFNPYDKRVKIISYAISPEEGYSCASYVFSKVNQSDLEIFKAILSNKDNILVGHNIKFDCNWIAVKFGIEIKAMMFDTSFALYLLDENRFEKISGKRNDLGTVAEEFIPGWKDHKIGINRDKLLMMSVNDELLYNNKDADASRRLFNVFIPKLAKQKLIPINNTAMEVLPVLSKIETRGIYLDREWARQEQTRLFQIAIGTRKDIGELVGRAIDPDSPKEMKYLLYDKLGYEVKIRTKNNQPSVDKVALKYCLEATEKGTSNERILRAVLEYRKSAKLLSTYYQPISQWTKYDGKVHPTYRLGKQSSDEGYGGTVTGRLSCDKPNLQQIPIGSSTRGMFAASPGYLFYDGDYSQLELRVAAYLSQERLMIDAFENGQDIHTAVMSDITGISYKEIEERREYDEDIKVQRVAIKRINFGILYGVQAARLQKLLWLDLGVYWELEKCESLINQWLDRYTSVRRWLDSTKRFAVDYRYVRMPFGQKRRLPDASYKTGEGRRDLRKAINFPVQSTASWICLVGMTLLDKWITSSNLNAHLLMQVHDSIGLEIHTDQATNPSKLASKISRVMEEDTLAYIRDVFDVKWNVPLQFKVTWGERWK